MRKRTIVGVLLLLISIWFYFRYRYLWQDIEDQINFISQYDLYDKESELILPKLIHQTWKDKDVPEQWLYDYEWTRYKMQDYEFHFWTDEDLRDLVSTEFPWFLKTYDSYPYNIQRVDAGRYFVLYSRGGIYMDLDIGCRRENLDPVLKFPIVIPRTKPIGFSNDFLVSSKGHPFFKKIIDSLQTYNHWYGTQFLTVLFSTGPVFLSLVYGSYQDKMNIRVLQQENYANTPMSLLVHRTGSTWHQDDAAFFLWFFKHRIAFTMVTIITAIGLVTFYLWRKKRLRSCWEARETLPKYTKAT
ncbi:mannosyl phosphorylinositol ceramide synthase SUR1 [Planoprotostelium fungivorum]|uniref:Mannosyl phosphorylinositol ceramide synthase SUR1 n=1 Tax=Planoprotostelium fungivorum TaxID=1890364 RepID=A0A2P6N232_9EUKA|nr:mannosyl phosphorylinositol ceramide synthase SUR1 [Planoprotostelium fungivorum]